MIFRSSHNWEEAGPRIKACILTAESMRLTVRYWPLAMALLRCAAKYSKIPNCSMNTSVRSIFPSPAALQAVSPNCSALLCLCLQCSSPFGFKAKLKCPLLCEAFPEATSRLADEQLPSPLPLQVPYPSLLVSVTVSYLCYRKLYMFLSFPLDYKHHSVVSFGDKVGLGV